MTVVDNYTPARLVFWNAGLIRADESYGPTSDDQVAQASFLWDGWEYNRNLDQVVGGSTLIARACTAFEGGGAWGRTWDECVEEALTALPEGATPPFTRLAPSGEPAPEPPGEVVPVVRAAPTQLPPLAPITPPVEQTVEQTTAAPQTTEKVEKAAKK